MTTVDTCAIALRPVMRPSVLERMMLGLSHGLEAAALSRMVRRARVAAATAAAEEHRRDATAAGNIGILPR